MDEVYLLNNPFTFQAMEKHSAYCAMMRLGLKVPATWMVPHKLPTPIARFEYMADKFADVASKYNAPFDLREIGARIGYPLYMKPFDGGQWVGVTRVRSPEELRLRYDESGERLMHLQAAVEPMDVFARSLSIGAETMVMHFEPDRPMHERYQVHHDFLSPQVGWEVVTVSRLVNAFFRWEFNSCETLVRGRDVYPIDYANASPDVAITSLHYYFPWAMKALVKWAVFCVVTGRRPRLYFDTERYRDFCASRLPHVDEMVLDWVASPDFDKLLVDTVHSLYPAHEHEAFLGHFRGLLGQWVNEQGATSQRLTT